ncbi:hypothetical protein [Litorivivens sp.]|uniref:hypothetical protein n=1 Tax=Litorivivens sp. TaxID=2020868 RepID=UPI003566C847
MRQLVQALLLGMLVVNLSGCPGDSDSDDGTPSISGLKDSSGSSGSSSSGDSSSSSSTGPTVARMGSTSGGTFTEGTIKANSTTLSAGESTSLSVEIVDQNGAPVTESAEIFFTSGCVSSGLSEITPAIATTNNGTVQVTYKAIGCDGSDTIRAQSSLNASTLSSTVSITATPAPLGAITFLSSAPNIVCIRGTGAIPEQSIVTFKVTNTAGGPVQNQPVDFKLNSSVGGVSLSNAQGTTDAEGLVSTTVISGDVQTTVRVTATTTRDGKTTTAQSNGLAVTTGIPDQDSFSISAETLNIEGLNLDGVTTKVNIRAADRYNNPVADGTAIAFTTEGGSIEGTCSTVAGVCSVTFTSQDPRPSNGRATVLAYAVGEETFVDANPSNGQFDDGESFTDISEAYRDDNESNSRDTNEVFVDFDSDKTFDNPDSLFNGLLCNGPTCAAPENRTLNVWENIVIVLSGSNLNVQVTPAVIDLNTGGKSVTVTVSDINGQVPPKGTTIKAETSQGKISGPSSFTVPNTNFNGALSYSIFVEPGTAGKDGVLTVTAETPSGTISTGRATVDQTP